MLRADGTCARDGWTEVPPAPTTVLALAHHECQHHDSQNLRARKLACTQ
jgi:hypothetical protein